MMDAGPADAEERAQGFIEFSSYAGFAYTGDGVLSHISDEFEGALDVFKNWELEAGEWVAYAFPIRHGSRAYRFFGFGFFLRDRAARPGYWAVGAAYSPDDDIDERVLSNLWNEALRRRRERDVSLHDQDAEQHKNLRQSATVANVSFPRPVTLAFEGAHAEPTRQVLQLLALGAFIPRWQPGAIGFVVAAARGAPGNRLSRDAIAKLLARIPTGNEVQMKIAGLRGSLEKEFGAAQNAMSRNLDRVLADLQAKVEDEKKKHKKRVSSLEARGEKVEKLLKRAAHAAASHGGKRDHRARHDDALAEAEEFLAELRSVAQSGRTFEPVNVPAVQGAIHPPAPSQHRVLGTNSSPQSTGGAGTPGVAGGDSGLGIWRVIGVVLLVLVASGFFALVIVEFVETIVSRLLRG